jgi:hypothetical protein
MPHATPEILAMIICDTVIEDVESGKKSLIGLFDHVHTSHLPSVVNELNVFLSLTDGHGQHSAELRCVNTATEEELFRTEGEVEFPDPLSVVDLHFRFQGCEFPEEGEYRFQFFCEGELLRERKFHVALEAAGEGEEGESEEEAGEQE